MNMPSMKHAFVAASVSPTSVQMHPVDRLRTTSGHDVPVNGRGSGNASPRNLVQDPMNPMMVSSAGWGHDSVCRSIASPEQYRPIGHRTAYLQHNYVALDCEMVGVGPGGKRSVLARVSIVDFYGNSLLDTFVQVAERVTDFRTHVSGIRPQDLDSRGAMPFGNVRRLVIKLIRNKVLVGHGLENDLNVLGIHHPWFSIRDTCLYQPYMQMDKFGTMRPKRLRDLARQHLGILIQQDGVPHDSMSDACAAMALYRNVRENWDFVVDCHRRDLAMLPVSLVPVAHRA